MVPVLVLLFVALWSILRGDLLYVLPDVSLFLCIFSPFSIEITSLGVERANLSAFRTFVRFALVWSVSASSWCLSWAAVCDCGTSWTFLLPFFFKKNIKLDPKRVILRIMGHFDGVKCTAIELHHHHHQFISG